jgi:hypothetical protein
MVTGITRYGDSTTYYDFTQSGVYLDKHSSNFGNKREMTRTIPYMDGNFRELGVNKSPNEAGNLQITGHLWANTREAMELKRRALEAVIGYGLKKLYFQPSDPELPELYTWAEAQVRMPRNLAEHSDLKQPFTLTFLCPDPYWYRESNTEFAVLGLNFFMGVSLLGGDVGGGFNVTASGVLTEATATNGGNAPTVGRISIRCNSTQTCENPIVQRIRNGQVYDYVSYEGILGNGDELVIDSRGHSVKLNGANAYDENFDFKHPRFIQLQPGANTIRVLFANASDAARVSITFEDAYFGS